MAPKVLADLLAANGGDELTPYLAARGISCCDMLARVAKTQDILETKLLNPFSRGVDRQA